MPVTTYAELKTEIQNWLGDDDVADFTDSFIAACEANLRRNLRVDELVERDTSVTVVENTREITLASTLSESYQDMMSIRIRRPVGEEAVYFPPLTQVTMEELTSISQETAFRPGYYHIVGGVLEFERPLDRDYDIDFFYYKKFAALSDSNTSNEILANYPDIYLWGSLVAAAPFIDNDERMQVWTAFYNGAMSDIRKMDALRNVSGPVRPSSRGMPGRRRY